jgi:L-fuconolactonase
LPALPEDVEPVIDPELPIIDAHHHLWRPGFPFPGAPYLLDELAADLASGHLIEATVLVEAHDHYRPDGPTHLRPVGETENGVATAAEAAARGLATRIAAGIVAYADLLLGAAVEEVLDAHFAAAPTRLRGIRQMVNADLRTMVDNRRLLTDPDFRVGLRRVAARGLTFDVFILHFQLPDLIDTARALPEVTFVLDHLGAAAGIGGYAHRREEVWLQWCADMATLAESPNVVVKLGGMNMAWTGFGWENEAKLPSSQQLADVSGRYYRYAIDCFGPSRCLFESNFPPDSIAGSYRTLWNAFKRIAEPYSATEKADLFAGTARRVYRLG